jgi:hypothetical protein
MELKKTALTISAGGATYEKASSRRVRQRLAHEGIRDFAVPLTHVPRATSSSFYTKVATENDNEQALWDLAKCKASKTIPPVSPPKSSSQLQSSDQYHHHQPGNQPIMRGVRVCRQWSRHEGGSVVALPSKLNQPIPRRRRFHSHSNTRGV